MVTSILAFASVATAGAPPSRMEQHVAFGLRDDKARWVPPLRLLEGFFRSISSKDSNTSRQLETGRRWVGTTKA